MATFMIRAAVMPLMMAVLAALVSSAAVAQSGGAEVAAYGDLNRPTEATPDEDTKALAAEIARIISAGKTVSAGAQADVQTEADSEALAKAIGAYVTKVNARNRRAALESVDMNRGAALGGGSGQVDLSGGYDLSAGYDPGKQAQGSQSHGAVNAEGQSQVAQQVSNRLRYERYPGNFN